MIIYQRGKFSGMEEIILITCEILSQICILSYMRSVSGLDLIARFVGEDYEYAIKSEGRQSIFEGRVKVKNKQLIDEKNRYANCSPSYSGGIFDLLLDNDCLLTSQLSPDC